MSIRAIPRFVTLCCSLTLLPAVPALAEEYISPSGNIFCLVDSDVPANGGQAVGFAHCEIFDYTPTLLQHPGDCPVDWGGAFSLEARGLTDMPCYGETQLTRQQTVVEYGQSIEQGGIRCEFARTGVTCTNLDGHGFFLSNARQRLF